MQLGISLILYECKQSQKFIGTYCITNYLFTRFSLGSSSVLLCITQNCYHFEHELAWSVFPVTNMQWKTG